MPSNELKCLEVLLRHVITASSLEDEIKSEKLSESSFTYIKGNLFNYLTIESLLRNIHNSPNFSLEDYLNNGTVTSKNIKVLTPTYDHRFADDYKRFYKELFKALAEDNFTFDDSNNILVSSENIETLVPREWLYCLSEFYKKSTYQRLFLFNKNTENDIVDQTSLLSYLHHTKTFIVTLESPDPNIDYDGLFMTAKIETERALRGQKEIKVDEIISIFKSCFPSNVKVSVSKYKLSDATWLIPQAERNERAFYTKPLDKQKDILNDWMLNYINSNDKALEATQRALPLMSPKNDPEYLKDRDKKNSIIVGLFNLYITLLSKMQIDYQNISLSSFKIDSYMDDEFQKNLVRLHEIVKEINDYTQKKELVDSSIEAVLASLDDTYGEELTKLEEDYSFLLNDRNKYDMTIQNLSSERNCLMATNRDKNDNSIEEIAFDNDRIMTLIERAVREGRVYLNPYNKNRLTIELHNDEIGKTIFRASISLEQLLQFVENNNFDLDDYQLALR